MPELRKDWLTGRQVIIAENRADRPNEFLGHGDPLIGAVDAPVASAPPAQAAAMRATCPFCAGHEGDTPPAVYQCHDDHGQWRVRVIPNKYPAVTLAIDDAPTPLPTPAPVEAVVAEFPCAELTVPPSPIQSAPRDELQIGPAVGAQEVIIEAPTHATRTGALTRAELRDVLKTYGARLRHWREDGRMSYGLVFKNQGPTAGASLTHLHSQLIALPGVPPMVAAESRRAAELFRDQQCCPYCRWIVAERAARERIVLDRDGFVAFCPRASLQPLEFWVLPTEHEPGFEQIDPIALDRLSHVLHALLNRLETLLPTANYNMIVRTGPWLPAESAWCHWRIEVLPRLATIAGLELGTGIYINPLSPERAAERLRNKI